MLQQSESAATREQIANILSTLEGIIYYFNETETANFSFTGFQFVDFARVTVI